MREAKAMCGDISVRWKVLASVFRNNIPHNTFCFIILTLVLTRGCAVCSTSPRYYFGSFHVTVSSHTHAWSFFCVNWTEQDYCGLECESLPADHLQSNDGSSPEPGALLALTLACCGCRLEQWLLTCERLSFSSPDLPHSNDVKLPVWLNVRAGRPVFASAVGIFQHTSSRVDTPDHDSHLGSCRCWPLAFNVFDHRKQSSEFPWPLRSLWNSSLILHLPWHQLPIHPSADIRFWIHCHQN